MKSILVVALAAAGALCAGTAQAGHVAWSIEINTPVVATVVSNAPAYPVLYAPAPRAYLAVPPVAFYEPEPVYAPAPYYAPAPVYYPRYGGHYRPVPVFYPHHRPHEWREHARWEGRGWRRD